jgi:hypothetical protein
MRQASDQHRARAASLGLWGWNHIIIEPHGPMWSKPPLREEMLLLAQRHIELFLI